MAIHQRVRPLAVAALLGAVALGAACTNEGTEEEGTNQGPAVSGRRGPPTDENPVGAAPNQMGQTRAEPTGAIGPGNIAGTSSVDPVKQTTKTVIDSTPDTRPRSGPGSE